MPTTRIECGYIYEWLWNNFNKFLRISYTMYLWLYCHTILLFPFFEDNRLEYRLELFSIMIQPMVIVDRILTTIVVYDYPSVFFKGGQLQKLKLFVV